MNEEINSDNSDEKPKFARFAKGHHIKEPVDLVLGISMKNKNLEGSNLLCFVNLMNENSNNIISLEILVGFYLHRYYETEKEVERKYEKWISENKPILDLLKPPYKIINWKDIIEEKKFKENHEKVKKLFETNDDFKKAVLNVSRNHTDKGDFEAVKNYLLEECAYFMSKKCNFTYPQPRLNIACVHIIENHNPNFIFRPYALNKPKNVEAKTKQPKKTKKNRRETNGSHSKKYNEIFEIPNFEQISSDEFINCCEKFSLLMQSFCLISTQQKEHFFSQFLKGNNEYLKLVRTRGLNSKKHNNMFKAYEKPVSSQISANKFIGCCKFFSSLMENFGFLSIEQKENFFSQFLRRNDVCLKQIDIGVHNDEKNENVSSFENRY